MSSKQIVEPTEEINILLRRTAVPKCDITPAVKGLNNYTQRQIELTSFTFAISARQKKSKTDEFFLKLTQAKDYLSSMV